MRRSSILIAWEIDELRRQLGDMLRRSGHEVEEALGISTVHRALAVGGTDLVIVGPLEGGTRDSLDTAQDIRQRDPRVPIILLVPRSSEERAVAALRLGVSDYFKSQFSLGAVAESVRRRLPQPGGTLGATSPQGDGPALLGTSRAIREINAYITRVACSESNVLITGETGTGKELTAALIHRQSPRRQCPFLCINCAAIPEALLESELFGHERGAFTGALTQREGKLRQANGGTVFFDEIGDMNPYAQAKILRTIESKEVHRVGGRGSLPVNLRVLAATNQELERKVAEGQFRHDLFFRLNVARIHLPPLRDRKEDLPVLLDHYLREFNGRFGRQVGGFTPEASAYLVRYGWPGNVRELRNLIEAIFINLPADWITVADLPEPFRRRIEETNGLPEDERSRVLSALFSTNWNKSQAAQRLHWSRMTLYRKMAKYHIRHQPEL